MDREGLNLKIKTYGCKVNSYDSGLIEKRIRGSGYFSAEELDDVHILNSCAVTHEATSEVLREARRVKRRFPNSKVVLTGCAAQVDGSLVDKSAEIDLVIGNSHKAELPQILKDLMAGNGAHKVHRSNIFRKDDLGAGGGVDSLHTRSFLKIQDGCNSFCSFCVIPYARGKSRSLSVNDLIEKVHELQALDYHEIVLTGVHIGDYSCVESGKRLGLEDLVENIINFTKIPRIRLSSLEPVEISDRLLEIYSDERMCPHFHLSLQSANTKVLKDMKRSYSSTDVESCFERISKSVKNPFIGMDVIVGFPGESMSDFDQTVDLLKNNSWNQIHVFPYSERTKTKAALRDDQVPWPERKRRSRVLRELSQGRYRTTAKAQIGTYKKVLLLEKRSSSEEGLSGLARDFWKVQLGGSPLEKTSPREVNVRIDALSASSGAQAPPLMGSLA